MTKTDKFETIWRFEKLIEYLKLVLSESIALDVERVEELTVKGFKSRGYFKAAKVRNAKKVDLEKLDFEAPTLESIIPLYEEIVKQLKTEDKPERSIRARIKAIHDKLAPYGSWATLAYTWLKDYGVI
jgi:hypothetical protein